MEFNTYKDNEGKIWITNGKKETMVYPREFTKHWSKQNWKPGRLAASVSWANVHRNEGNV